MQFLIVLLIAIVILEAIIILKLRAKIKQSETQNSIHLLNEDTQSEEEIDSNHDAELASDLSEEENKKQAEKVIKVKILCQIAEVHLDDLSDEYESNMLMERIEEATEMTKDIDDPFYSGAALHFIISLAHRAGWNEKKNGLLEMVSDPFIKEKIMEEIDAENT